MEKYEQREKTRKWLRGYRCIVKEIRARNQEIEDFIKENYNPLMATQYGDMPKSKGTTSDPTYNAVIRIEKQYSQMLVDMQNKVDNLVAARIEIEEALNFLDAYERCVVYYTLILGKKWIDVSDYINYEERNCHYIENRALDKISKRNK